MLNLTFVLKVNRYTKKLKNTSNQQNNSNKTISRRLTCKVDSSIINLRKQYRHFIFYWHTYAPMRNYSLTTLLRIYLYICSGLDPRQIKDRGSPKGSKILTCHSKQVSNYYLLTHPPTKTGHYFNNNCVPFLRVIIIRLEYSVNCNTVIQLNLPHIGHSQTPTRLGSTSN